MNAFFETVGDLLRESGFYYIISYFKDGGWQTLVMLLLSLVLIYLAIVKKFEPLLLLSDEVLFTCLQLSATQSSTISSLAVFSRFSRFPASSSAFLSASTSSYP